MVYCIYYTMKTKEHFKQFLRKITKKHKLGDESKKMYKSLNVSWSIVKPIIKKWR